MYQEDCGKLPDWLSNTYPEYMGMPKSFVCLCDKFKGHEGCKPPWQLPDEKPDMGWQECDDFGGSEAQQADPAGYALMNHNLPANSYLYEFNPARCSWWKDGPYTWEGQRYDTSELGEHPSWREVRTFEMGIVGPHAPIVSCYWHVKQNTSTEDRVLRAGAKSGNVYRTSVSPDDWKSKK
jgi:hypothetical protein